MEQELSGRVVVVTGASAGIGRATAVAFGRRGEKVALLARGEKGLAAAAEDVRAAGGTPLVIGVDVSDADAVEAAADRVETELGPIDVGCNAAFTTAFSRFEEISAKEVNAPGVSTPQFSWVLNRLPKRPRPVAPIHQPEVLGEAMAYVSEHPRRRAWWVVVPTVDTILGEKVSPQFLDWYLARSGVKGQQTDQDAEPSDPVNLWEPVDGPDGRDFGTQGQFSGQAWTPDPQIWAGRHHGTAAVVGAAASAGIAALRRKKVSDDRVRRRVATRAFAASTPATRRAPAR